MSAPPTDRARTIEGRAATGGPIPSGGGRAAFWSLDSGMQGLPDIQDTSEEEDNRDSY